jgi:hypothetical protein
MKQMCYRTTVFYTVVLVVGSKYCLIYTAKYLLFRVLVCWCVGHKIMNDIIFTNTLHAILSTERKFKYAIHNH